MEGELFKQWGISRVGDIHIPLLESLELAVQEVDRPHIVKSQIMPVSFHEPEIRIGSLGIYR